MNDREKKKLKIGIIGAGVSGLGCAFMLSEKNDVEVFESAPRVGGHARTIFVGNDSEVPVDTGFIVFNYENYPHLTRMFENLNVPI